VAHKDSMFWRVPRTCSLGLNRWKLRPPDSYNTELLAKYEGTLFIEWNNPISWAQRATRVRENFRAHGSQREVPDDIAGPLGADVFESLVKTKMISGLRPSAQNRRVQRYGRSVLVGLLSFGPN